MNAIVTNLDLEYQPPQDDPRQSGHGEWRKLCEQLRFAREALAAAEADATEARRTIVRIEAENDTLKDQRDSSMREAVAMRTSLECGANILLQVLTNARDARNGPDAYKPPARLAPIEGEPITPEDEVKLREIVTKLGPNAMQSTLR